MFEVVYFPRVSKEDIPSLPSKIRVRIKKAIEERLRTHPVEFGKPLQYSWIGHRRMRVGDYRIVYKIDIKNRRVIVVLIKHRKDVYRQTSRF